MDNSLVWHTVQHGLAELREVTASELLRTGS
ncbi:MAG: hypothetical protein ABI811_19995 [Acidobacteriota bacterium]